METSSLFMKSPPAGPRTRREHARPTHPRYSISAAGNLGQISPFLISEPRAVALLTNMLHERVWYEDITHTDDEVLRVLNGLKPVWSIRLDSFRQSHHSQMQSTRDDEVAEGFPVESLQLTMRQ